MNFSFEVKKVNSGTDRYEEPFVEIVLRTPDFNAMVLSKYMVQKKPMRIHIDE
jgi:hypothetical protein